MIHSELTSTLESHNLFSVCQFVFRKNHSTAHLLLEAAHDWARECPVMCSFGVP